MRRTYSKTSKRVRRTYSKTSKREKDLLKIQQERKKELLKNQQQRELTQSESKRGKSFRVQLRERDNADEALSAKEVTRVGSSACACVCVCV